MAKSKLCKSCSGPLNEYSKKDLKNPDFCPYCVDKMGNLKDYKDILEGMINYIQNDHPEIKEENRTEKAVEWLKEGPVWGEIWTGVIIEESLNDNSVLDKVKIEKTEVSEEDDDPSENHGFPVWHLHSVSLARVDADMVAEKLSESLKSGPWWVDLKGKEDAYVIFSGRIFKGEIGDKTFEEKVNNYASKVGCPDSQLPF